MTRHPNPPCNYVPHANIKGRRLLCESKESVLLCTPFHTSQDCLRTYVPVSPTLLNSKEMVNSQQETSRKAPSDQQLKP
jgi:hypothetical protein